MFDVLSRDHRAWATRTLSSWDHGWRAALLGRYRQHAEVEDVTIPPAGQQMICLLLQGEKLAEVFDGSSWRSARVTAGAISMTSPHRATRIRWRSLSDRPLDHLSLHLPSGTTARIVEELWDRDPDHVRFPDALAKPDPLLQQAMAGLLRAVDAGAPNLYAESAAEFITVHALINHGSMTSPRSYSREDDRIRRARKFLRDNLDFPISLAAVADEVRLSRYHFLRTFRQQTGETPHRYLTRVRMDRARDELERGSATIGEVAQRCGFTNASQFARAFRRENGHSPSAYRNLHRPT